MSDDDEVMHEIPGELLRRIAEPHPHAAKDWAPLPKHLALQLAGVMDAIEGAATVQNVLGAALVVGGLNDALVEQDANLSPAVQEGLSTALSVLIEAAAHGMHGFGDQLQREAQHALDQGREHA